MTLVKTVEMRVLADAGDAQAKLDDLNAKADKLDGNAIRMRFRLDDAEGKAQLDAIRERADKLGFKDISIKVKVDGAGRAIAELDAVKREKDKAGGSLLSRMGSALVSPLSEGGAGPIPGFLTSPAGIAVAVAGAAALLTEVTGLVSGFAAAGAGAGAFYLLAHPAINNLTGDVKALDAANQAQGFAQQAERLDPTKAHAKTLAAANLKYNAVYAQMGQDAGGAASGMIKLHDSYVKLAAAFQPQVFKIFNDGLKIAGHLLPAVVPFANTFANVLDGLLKKADKFTQSKGFAGFLKQFHGIEGPALTSIGTGIGKVVSSVGKLLTTMSGKDVAHSINIAFGALSGAITGVTGAVKGIMIAWDWLARTAPKVVQQIAVVFDGMRHEVAHVWDQVFENSIGTVIRFGHNVAAVFDGIGHIFEHLFSGPHPGGHAFDTIRHDAAAAFDAMVAYAKTIPGKIVAAFDRVGHDIASKFDTIRHDVAADFDAAVAYVKTIPGKIISALAALPGMMWRAGVHAIESLISGITSMIGKIGSVMGGIASKVAGFFGLSPAKEGPLSAGGAPWIRGQHLVQDIAGGMLSAQPGLASAARQIAGTAAGAAGMRGGGGGIVINNNFGIVTDPQGTARQIHQLMLEHKRNNGRVPLGLG